MTAPELTLFCLVSFLFLFVGGVIGWLGRNLSFEFQRNQGYLHPEFFDDDGNVIADEVIAVRFDPLMFEEIEEARQVTEKVGELISQLPQNVSIKSRAFIEKKFDLNSAKLNNEIKNIDQKVNSEQAYKQTRERIERITKENEAIAHLLKNIG